MTRVQVSRATFKASVVAAAAQAMIEGDAFDALVRAADTMDVALVGDFQCGTAMCPLTAAGLFALPQGCLPRRSASYIGITQEQGERFYRRFDTSWPGVDRLEILDSLPVRV